MLWPLLVQRGSACRICFVPRGPRNCFCSWPPCPLPLQNQLHQGRDRKVKCMARWQNQIWFQNCSHIFYWWLPHGMIWMAKSSTWSCSQHGASYIAWCRIPEAFDPARALQRKHQIDGPRIPGSAPASEPATGSHCLGSLTKVGHRLGTSRSTMIDY